VTKAVAEKPFHFYTQAHLKELTGLKARNISELLEHIRQVSGSVIYHHTHHFLQQHQYLSPEPPNDFAYWVTEALNETRLGERLAAINTCEFDSIRALREKIIQTLENDLETKKEHSAQCEEGNEFYFIKTVSFILPTPYHVRTLREFRDTLIKVSTDSIYFHVFEARLRLEKGQNDFSWWLETALGEKDLADKIIKLDPYTYTMEALRQKLIRLMDARLGLKGEDDRT